MTAITNGIYLHRLNPYCATFFVFSDFMKPMIRLPSSQLPVTFVLTHDLLGLVKMGPIHELRLNSWLKWWSALNRKTYLYSADYTETVEHGLVQ